MERKEAAKASQKAAANEQCREAKAVTDGAGLSDTQVAQRQEA